jgi:hypothetical protein
MANGGLGGRAAALLALGQGNALAVLLKARSAQASKSVLVD